MSPHALDEAVSDNEVDAPVGAAISNGTHSIESPDQPQLLDRVDDEEIHDLVCVGFGPASLSIAVALYDAVEDQPRHPRTHSPKVRFLERQPQFAWHPGMMLPGTKMQISFIKDLATLRNPRSKFTFLNYLHSKGRISAFSNLGTFLPERIEFEDYMRWCADHFQNVVDYSNNVQAIDAGPTNQVSGKVDYFHIRTWDWKAERICSLKTRHVVIAVGGEPSIPAGLDIEHPNVIHSSLYASRMDDLSHTAWQPRSVAIVGGGQSAAEVFCDVSSRYPNAKTHLLIRGSALKPSDDSPFVNEIFDPEQVDDIYSQDPDSRAETIAENKATNYGVVRLELLERIYSTQYSQRLQYSQQSDWPQQMWTNRSVTGIDILSKTSQHPLRLNILNTTSGRNGSNPKSETLDVDLVVIGSGYRRDAHKRLLKPLKHLLPEQDREADHYDIDRDYSVRFDKDSVQTDAGIWLQGCNESTHGLSDTLLSLLSIRGGELVESIFGK